MAFFSLWLIDSYGVVLTQKSTEKQRLDRLLPRINTELIHNVRGVSVSIYLILSPYFSLRCVVLSLHWKKSIRAEGSL